MRGSGRSGLAAAAVALALAGCGSAAAPPSTPTAPAQGGPGPVQATQAQARLSPAKRRYLAHFRVSCRGVDRFTADTTARIQALVARISAGDPTAAHQLTAYLSRLARAFGDGLVRTRTLGPPPGPDARDGRAYFRAAAEMVAAIRRLGQAVSQLDAGGVAAANRQLQSATLAAHAAATRYGFPSCAPSAGNGPLAGQVA